MSCNYTLSNLMRTCGDKESKGGLYTEIYVAEHDKVTVTLTDGEITAITLADGASWYTYQFSKNAAIFDSEFSFDGETGDPMYCTNNLTLSFRKQEASKRASLVALCNSETFVIVKDANGIYYAMGVEEYVSCTSASATTGQARTDVNRYDLVLTDTTKSYPLIIPQSVIDTLFND